jgi:hypothetical protein
MYPAHSIPRVARTATTKRMAVAYPGGEGVQSHRNSEAEPNSQLRGINIRNNLIRKWVLFISKLSGTPYRPHIPVLSDSSPQLNLLTLLPENIPRVNAPPSPQKKILGSPLHDGKQGETCSGPLTYELSFPRAGRNSSWSLVKTIFPIRNNGNTHNAFRNSGCTMDLGMTQPLTEMSTRNISWG